MNAFSIPRGPRTWLAGVAGLALVAVIAVVVVLVVGGGSKEPSAASLLATAADEAARLETFAFTLRVDGVKGGTGLTLTFAEGEVDVVDQAIKAEVVGNLAGASLQSQLVAVEGKVVILDPFTKAWRAVDVETNPIGFFDPVTGVIATMRGARAPRIVGEEIVAGIATRRVEATVTASAVVAIFGNSPSDAILGLTIWVGKDDGRMRRIELVGRLADTEAANAKRVVELSRFDEPVAIVLPPTPG